MATKYRAAKEPAQIGLALMQQYHNDLVVNDVRVEFAFVDNAIKVGGKEVLGQCRKVGGHSAYLASGGAERFDDPQDPFFLITIWEEAWNSLTGDQRLALIDHELCHAIVDFDAEGNMKLKIRPHDIEEFNCIVSRHGLWLSDVSSFVFAAREHVQRTMDFEVEAA